MGIGFCVEAGYLLHVPGVKHRQRIVKKIGYIDVPPVRGYGGLVRPAQTMSISLRGPQSRLRQSMEC